MNTLFFNPLNLIGLIVFTTSALAQPHLPDTHTILLLHFDNTLSGADGEIPVQANGLTFESGIFNQAILINNTDVLDYGTPGNFTPPAGTIEFWIKPQWNGNNGTTYTFFSVGTQRYLPNNLLIEKDGANNLRFIMGVDDSEAYQAYNLAHWVANQWHHIAVTWNIPGEMKTYIDGMERISHTASNQDLISTVPPTLSVGSIANSFQVNAVIEELRISDVARSPDEIAESFAAGLTISDLTIQPVATVMWPTWQQTPTLNAVTNLGTVMIPPGAATWMSSDPNVATVDTTGKVTAIAAGSFNLIATIQSVSDSFPITVEVPLLPVEFGPIDPFLAAPASGNLYEIPVVIIRYLPTADGINLDVAFDPDFWWLNSVSLAEVKSRIDAFDKWIKFALEEGSRFRGYKDSLAQPSLGFKVVDYITIYEPTPPGKVATIIQGYPIYGPDFHQIFNRFNGDHYVNNLGVKEFWLWNGGVDPNYPSFDPTIHKPENFRLAWESNMASPLTGDISNSNRDNSDLPIYNQTYLVYGQNHRRSQAEAIHVRGHQLEAMLGHANYLQDGNTDLFWKKFIGQDAGGNFITGRCGWTHMPPNTTQNYDYLNSTLVESDIEDWTPEGIGVTTWVNFETWGNQSYVWPDGPPPSQKIESQWYIYWMQNMPGRDHIIPYGQKVMTNWWEFTGDWDGSIQSITTQDRIGMYPML
jgi:hypothetical protein